MCGNSIVKEIGLTATASTHWNHITLQIILHMGPKVPGLERLHCIATVDTVHHP